MSLPADPRKKVASNGNGAQVEANIPCSSNSEETGETVISSNATSNPNSVNASDGDEVILATAGYDHTIKFWQAHTGQCIRTLQHADSQVICLLLICLYITSHTSFIESICK